METVSVITRLAIQSYQKIAKLKTKLEIAEREHEDTIVSVPDEDMEEFMTATEKIQGIEDEKLETFCRRREKRARKAEMRGDLFGRR